MGNYRFRLSDMMPNAWFYKLKDMGNKGRKSQPNSRSMNKCYPTTRTSPSPPVPKPSTPPSPEPKEDLLPRRGSYYISSRVGTDKFPANSPFHLKASDTHFLIDLPRRSKRRSRRKASKASHTTTSSVSAGCSCTVWKSSEAVADFPSASHESRPCDRLHCIHGRGSDLHKPIISNKIEFDGFDGVTSWSHSCSFWVTTSATDITIELGTRSSISRKLEKVRDCNVFSEHGLPRILTKPAKKEAGAVKLDNADMYAKQGFYHSGCSVKEQSKSKSAVKRSPPGLQRHRLRESSSRLVGDRVEVQRSRKSSDLAMTAKGLRESFAIIISSSDPQRDFRDSMVEMIVENNIRASKDLEELLACYLSLNSKEYHDVIVKVFEQIWFDLTNIRL